MAENIRIDSHKLIYHPEAVASWLRGEMIYPIEVEISPSGACNHRCVFCAVDYLGYKPSFLDKDVTLKNIKLMRDKGLKSVICSGEGEPLLNKDISDIVNDIKEMGVDVAISSNGVLFDREFAETCLKSFTWVRFSVASMEETSYLAIQRPKEGDLEIVKKNIADVVEIKKKLGLRTTIGVQCLLLPGNVGQLSEMAKELRNIGVDYLTVKPFSQHLQSNNQMEVDYDNLLELSKEISEYATQDFAVYFRVSAMERVHCEKKYKKCLGLPFMTHIDAKGNVWPCVAHVGVEEFCYGNIYEKSFPEIWEGEQRQKVTEKLWSMDINKVCREACRLDLINQYLDELKNPGEHVNFI